MEDKKQGFVNRIGILGIVLGTIALGIAVFQDNLRGTTQPEPTLKELAIDAGKDLIGEKILGKENVEEESRDVVSLAHMGLGLAAMICGVVSWIRKDHIRLSGAAVALGLVAIAWQYVLVGVVIAVVVLILANITA